MPFMIKINLIKYLKTFSILSFFFSSILCSNVEESGQDSALYGIQLPPGFKIKIYARNVQGARSMALSPGGVLFVGTRDYGKVYAVLDTSHNNKADEIITIARGLNMPNGVAFFNGDLYVAEANRIIRFDNIIDHLHNPPQPVVIYDRFPNSPLHEWKYIRFGPDGKLYVSVGAPCNACIPSDTGYATIMRMNPDGSDPEVFAMGIRNSMGFDWEPGTNVLWFTDNGRDLLGDNIPPDELNSAPVKGMDFGFPYVYGDNIPDPEFGNGVDVNKFIKPAIDLGPHVAALGMRFYTGKMFPANYKGQIFIAEHGSWNRSVKIGYRISVIKLNSRNIPVSYFPFAQGWLKGNTVTGKPVDIQIMPDGAMLVSDDFAGMIYRISFPN